MEMSGTTSAARNARANASYTSADPNVRPKPGAAEESPGEFRFRVSAQTLVLLFPVFVALAGIAAFWCFGTTIPGHLGKGPGGAP